MNYTINAHISRIGYRSCNLADHIDYGYCDYITDVRTDCTDIMYETDVLAVKANGNWWIKEGYEEDVKDVLSSKEGYNKVFVKK